MANMPDKAGKRLCEIEGYEQCMTRYWLDPDGTLWSGPSIKSWWTTASGTDVYDLATARGRHTVSVSTLRRDAFGVAGRTYLSTISRNPLRVAAIDPEGQAHIFESARQAGKVLNYQGGDVARTARHNGQILCGEQTFSYKGIRRLRGWRVFLLDSLNKQHKKDFYALL